MPEIITDREFTCVKCGNSVKGKYSSKKKVCFSCKSRNNKGKSGKKSLPRVPKNAIMTL